MSVEFRESETLVLVVPPAWAPGLGSEQAELPTSRVDPVPTVSSVLQRMPFDGWRRSSVLALSRS
jgi:hypothetical protein